MLFGLAQVLNWGNITWWWRVNVNMLGSIDRNKKLRTWSQELGPYSLAVTAAALDDDVLAAVRPRTDAAPLLAHAL